MTFRKLKELNYNRGDVNTGPAPRSRMSYLLELLLLTMPLSP